MHGPANNGTRAAGKAMMREPCVVEIGLPRSCLGPRGAKTGVVPGKRRHGTRKGCG